MLAPFDDPTNHRLFSVSDEHAVSAWHNILLSYFPERVSVRALAAVHGANMALLEECPAGTVTLGVLRAGAPMPRSDARAYAAKIGREATSRLRGECIIVSGHPMWARMARAVLHTIELVSTPLHPRAVFDSPAASLPWVLERAGRPLEDAPVLGAAFEALIASAHRRSRSSIPAALR